MRIRRKALRLSAELWPFWLRRIELARGAALARRGARARARATAGTDQGTARRGGDRVPLGRRSASAWPRSRRRCASPRELGDPALEWRTLHFRAAVEIADDDGVLAASYSSPRLRSPVSMGSRRRRQSARTRWARRPGSLADVAGRQLCAESFELFGALEDSTGARFRRRQRRRDDPPRSRRARRAARVRGHPAAVRRHLLRGARRLCPAQLGERRPLAGDDREARALLERGAGALREGRERAGSRRRAGRVSRTSSSPPAIWTRRLSCSSAPATAGAAGRPPRRSRSRSSGSGRSRRRRAIMREPSGLLQEAFDTFRRAGDRWGLASTLWRSADLELARGRPDAAEERLEEALAVVGETRRVRWRA